MKEFAMSDHHAITLTPPMLAHAKAYAWAHHVSTILVPDMRTVCENFLGKKVLKVDGTFGKAFTGMVNDAVWDNVTNLPHVDKERPDDPNTTRFVRALLRFWRSGAGCGSIYLHVTATAHAGGEGGRFDHNEYNICETRLGAVTHLTLSEIECNVSPLNNPAREGRLATPLLEKQLADYNAAVAEFEAMRERVDGLRHDIKHLLFGNSKW
jgi:hypothetical protein